MKMEFVHPADQICMIMERIYDMDMTSLTGGNISMMDDEGVMWITPSSIDKKSLTRDDIVKVLPDGTMIGKHKPTSEYYIHRKILLERPDMKAVVHAHAPATVTMSVLNRVPDTELYQASHDVAGVVGMTPYVLPGSMRLADVVKDAFVEGYDAVILEKHSAFVGSTKGLFDAFARFEALDFAARTEINAQVVGKLKKINPDLYIERKFPGLDSIPEYTLNMHTGTELELRNILKSILVRGYRKKLFTSLIGTMSVRVDEHSFLIPEAGADNGTMKAEKLILMKNGKREAGKIPHETAFLHQMIYEKHPEVQSVICAAPVYTMGFLVTDTIYDTTLYPESYGVLCKANRYSFEELYKKADQVTKTLDLEHPIAMVEHWGIVLVGKTPILTFDKLEVCESCAQSIHEGKRMGLDMILMTEEQIQEMNG